jgi:hypothetical protein
MGETAVAGITAFWQAVFTVLGKLLLQVAGVGDKKTAVSIQQ